MNSPPSSLSRRGFLTTSGTLGATSVVGRAQTTTTTDSSAPEPVWTFSRSDGFYRIVIEDGRVYALASSSSMAGNPNHTNVYAVKLPSGKKQWSIPFPSASSIIAENDTVYLTKYKDRPDSKPKQTIAAFAAEDGKERWTHSLSGYPARNEVGDGLVFVGGESVVVLDEKSGKKQWDAKPKGRRVHRLIHRGTILYVGTDEGVYAYSADDGKERWNTANSGPEEAYLTVVDDERVYCLDTADGAIIALSADDGTTKWTVPIEGGSYSFPVLHDGSLYHWGKSLSAIDVAAGKLRWEYDTNNSMPRRPIVADGAVFAVSDDGVVYAVNTDGKERWTFETDDTGHHYNWGDVRDGIAYVVANRGLFALSAENGERRWLFETDEPVQAASVSGGKVVLATRGGLYGFDHKRSILDTATDFLGSGSGLALSGVLLGTGVLAAYRRMNAESEAEQGVESDAESDAELEPEPKYGRLERLARDELTETYRVRKEGDDAPVVAERTLTDSNLAEQFREAVERWAELSDRRGVVPVLDFGDDWLELPYYEGWSVADGDRPLAERIDALSNANATIHRAHRDGIVHGGLEPGSILVDADGTGHVADWELASALAEHTEGSLYDAPEQVAGESADERTDVYRLGAIATILVADDVSGEESGTPDSLPDPSALPCSQKLADVLATATADDPDDRYESVVKFDDMLRWAAFRA